jgi:hypothetical protein
MHPPDNGIDLRIAATGRTLARLAHQIDEKIAAVAGGANLTELQHGYAPQCVVFEGEKATGP